MKNLVVAAIMFLSSASFAYSVKSEDVQLSAARVTNVVNLLTKIEGNGQNLVVNVVVQDLGGSTDLFPTQKVYLTMYAKGEEFSTDATFKITDAFDFQSAKRISAGIYEVSAAIISEDGDIENVVFRIDGKKASADIQKVDCGGEFDCDASTNFSSSVEVIAVTKK